MKIHLPFAPALVVLALFLSPSAHAFPEMIRAGYTNCSTCHFNPNGGGLLTPYGRALSKEVLSNGKFFFEYWFEKNSAPGTPAAKTDEAEAMAEESPEPKFMYGAFPMPSWLNAGLFLRGLMLFIDNPATISLQYIPMQTDAEVELEYWRFRADGMAGINWFTFPSSIGFVSRRHYLTVLAGPDDAKDKVQIWGGRYYSTYGLNIPEHNIVTRRFLNFGGAFSFDENKETYNAEAAYIGDTLNVAAGYIFGRPDQPAFAIESGPVVQASMAIGTNYKIGVNAISLLAPGAPASSRRWIQGAWAVLGFLPHFYTLAELNIPYFPTTGAAITDYLKVGWEFVQGCHLFVSQEYFNSALSTAGSPLQQYYGVGIQYFPRPHFEFDIVVKLGQDTVATTVPGLALQTYGMLNFYL
ncbi:MAG: hypothetical protein ACXWPM_00860 [Bdellovibrionota bacterium]